MKDIEYILDFAVNLGARMLTCGANLERVEDTMNRVCLSYNLYDVSFFSLSTLIQVSARSGDWDYASRQITVPAMDIHLERLNRLNQLSRTVCREKPEPSGLIDLLNEAEEIDDYPVWQHCLARMVAMASLCVLFGGGAGDIAASVIINFILYWLIDALSRRSINHIIMNITAMFVAGAAAMFLTGIGVGEDYFIIIITCSMMLIPGIPLVNAARNLLCGNEMNGILETLKAVVESLAIVLGICISMYIFGGFR